MKTITLFTLFFVLILALNSCGSSGDDKNDNSNGSQQVKDEESSYPKSDQKNIYECDATKTTENRFSDTFVTYGKEDIRYEDSKNYSSLSVKDIEDIFNYARALDPSISNDKKMTLPSQRIWDEMDAGQKILYLANSERCARGIRPFEGIDTTLENEVVKPYADYISTHIDDFEKDPHNADGKTPQERIESSTDLKLGTNMQSLFENIATFAVGSSIDYQIVYESEAKAVYGWMYTDKSQNYGHRKSLLVTGLIDDSAKKDEEGIIAAYTAQSEYEQNGLYWRRTFCVMDGVDPTSSWDNDLENIKRVPLYR